MKNVILWNALLALLLIAGCSTPGSAPAPSANPTAPSSAPTRAEANAAPAGSKGDPSNGSKLFTQKNIECDKCHDATQPYPGGDYGPNLGNISTVADQVIKASTYTGKATTVPDYLRESILNPNIYFVPGEEYREKDGTSGMTQDFAQTLTPQQVEDLIAYLLTLK